MSGPLRPGPAFSWDDALLIRGVTHDEETGLPYPEPTVDRPTGEDLWAMVFDGSCPATDGCEVEPDGTCPHGHPAWPRRMGLV